MIILRAARQNDRLGSPRALLDGSESQIAIVPSEIFMTEGMTTTVKVYWRLQPASANMMDWIGLYYEGDSTCARHIDYKNLQGLSEGSIKWPLPAALLDRAEETKLIFRYFNGISGALRASSTPVRISSRPRLLISDLACHGLPRAHGRLRALIEAAPSFRATTHVSETGTWKGIDLDVPLPSSSSDCAVRIRVLEAREGEDETIVDGRVPIADFIAAAKQELSVSVRTPLLHRRLHDRQPPSVLLHFALLPATPEPPPPPPPAPSSQSASLHASRASSASSMNSMNCSMVSASSSSSSASSSSSGISSGGSNHSNLSLVKEKLGPLPEGWESRIDWHGRIFFLDHVNRKTTWTRPTAPSTSTTTERRARRGDEGAREERATVEGTPSKIYHPSRRTITHDDSGEAAKDPIAVRFLQRDDFMALLHANETALRIYNASRVVKHMVHRIRRGADTSLAMFEQNEEFVRFVNTFADATQRLPECWQAAGEFPVVFLNHSTRQTTLLDPRLPLPSDGTRRHRRTRSAPPRQSALHDVNGNFSPAEIANAVARRRPEIANRIRRKLRALDRWGEAGLARLANDIDIVTAISLLETEENKDAPSPSTAASPEQEEFDEKVFLFIVGHFYTSLQRSGYGAGPSKLKLRFSRSALLHDAFDQILAADVTQLRRAKLSIAFDDEDGLDYGGPSRELFYLLSRELFNPYYGLFEYAAPDRYVVQISPMSSFVDNHSKWMELAGRVLGLALVHRCLIDSFFIRTFYKQLLELPLVLEDLETVDPEFCRSLLWMRANRVTEDLGFSFSVTQEIAGEVTEKELLPNGRDLPVTDRNKEQFIQLMIKWRVERGVQPQARALLRGLHQIIDRDFLRVFSVEQLELVLSGSVEIDLDDWQTWTEYKGGYSSGHVVIRWFWDTVEEMSNADRLKLLQFVTGTASVPYEGFRALRGSNGSKKFTIEKWGDEKSLPRAHTCFNRLDLPSYPSKRILCEKMRLAINEGIAYAIE